MKKFYVYSVFALACASALSAAPKAAQATQWGEWENYTTATFDAQWFYRKPMENLQVMRRFKVGDEDRVQYKVLGMFGDAPGCQPVDLVIDADFTLPSGPKGQDIYIWVDQQFIESYDVSGTKTNINLADGYTYYDKFFPSNPDYAMQYEDASYYRPETGTFTIYSVYHYDDGSIPFMDAFYKDQTHGVETLRLHGPEFKNYTPEFSDGQFEKVGDDAFYFCDVKINDLSQIKMSIQPGTDVDAKSIATKMNDGLIDCVTVKADGQVKIPFDGAAGKYTLVYLTYKADGTTYQYSTVDLEYDPYWVTLGDALFTDGFISKFLEVDMTQNLGLKLDEADFTYSVKIQQSTTKPGLYRLVNPYGASSPYYDINFSNINLDKKKTYYLTIDASNPDQVTIPYSDSGFFYGQTPLVLYSEAYDYLNDGYDATEVPSHYWGKLSDGVITFPEGTGEADAPLSLKLMTSPASVYGRALTVKLPSSSVSEIEADDSEAPVEYFNLQGVRVTDPANGIFIRRQGSDVTKVVVR